ncbi:MAG: purine-nucleoside phosphorylase [Sphaerochaetaceae bacterium]|nr:purine-nucleoside phosphorylase [Sphaerochaetaceae bacterium]MDD3942097.1 purine-nucleoside phosphorylase [Sphaerochaetaceae bacterium]
MRTPTIHIGAAAHEIARTILLPGDPLRAKYIAENFLEEAVLYSQVRGMYGYSGRYKGVPVSVQGTGMGGPSMGIYAYELIHAYGVERLIRIGSAGALQDHLRLGDLIGVTAAHYDTDYAKQHGVPGTIVPAGSFGLLETAYRCALDRKIALQMGTVLSSDLFYHLDGVEALRPWARMGALAVEMEAASLYMTAQSSSAQAACLLTISDLPFGENEMSSEERERSLTDMIVLGLETAVA